MTVLPIAPWCPDSPDLTETTNIATNVLALTEQSYGPVNRPKAYSINSLATQCFGMGFAEDTDLAHHIFAGTTTKLELIDEGSNAWADVSGAVYTTAAGETWHFAQYNNLELATNFTDKIQSYDMIAGGTFANLAAAAPHARYIAVAKTFAIVANTDDPIGGTNPARIWWSAAGDPTNWPTPGSTTAQQTQSDFSDLLGPQGPIAGLAPNLTGCDCAVFFERGVFRMIYVGPPDIFDFYPAASVRGSPAPNSIVPLGNVVYYFGEDGFYMFDGNQSQPIGANKVDKWFFANVDQSALQLVVGAPDINNKAIVWIFRSVFAPSALPDQALIYRWDIQMWSFAQVTTQWASRAPVTLAAATVPLALGQLELAVVDSSGFLAFMNGTPLPAQVGTKVVQITPGRRTFVNATRPLINASGSGGNILTESGLILLTEDGFPLSTEDSQGVFTVAMSARNSYFDPEMFGQEVAPDSSGQCSQRSDGRYHRGRISVSGIWTTIAGLDVSGIRAGQR